MLATFYVAAQFDTCLKAGNHRHAKIWLDVIRAVEAMSESQSCSCH